MGGIRMRNKFYQENYDEFMSWVHEDDKVEFNISNAIVFKNHEVWQVWGHIYKKGFTRIVGEFDSLVAAVNSIPFDELGYPYKITAIPWDYNESDYFSEELASHFKSKYPRYVSVNNKNE